MPASPTSPTSQRLFFFDWIRIAAFFLLILYHTGMYYVSWDFHIKSVHAGPAIEPLMMLSSPWRLSLLFLISGVASAWMLDKMSVASFVGRRSYRLLLPLVFGMLVIVPPQSYFEVVEKVGYQGNYIEFMRLYISGYHGFCRADDCLSMPTWNHLWFVNYLWNYSLVLALLAWLPGKPLERLAALLGRVLTGWAIIVLPLIVLAALRLSLLSRFPSTHGLFDDWYNHANYFTVFLLGALLAKQAGFWHKVEALRFVNLGLALTCWALLVVYFTAAESMMAQVEQWRQVQRVVYALCQWSAMLAICGFGHRHLQFDSAKRRYLSQAVFPLYIVHQTLIIVFAFAMKRFELPPVTEGLVLVVLTMTCGFGIFEAVRRVPGLRTVFGVSAPRPAAVARRVEGAAAAA